MTTAPETARPPVAVGTSVVLCRGCCCGSAATRPGVDHAGQRHRLERFADGSGSGPGVRLLVTECLGPCDQANVVVVRPSPAGRRAGGRPVWFGLVDDVAVGLIERWVAAGGPGVVPIPDLLDLQRIPRPGSSG